MSIINFGRHKGRDIRTVPASYLAAVRMWSTEERPAEVQELIAQAEEEWKRRNPPKNYSSTGFVGIKVEELFEELEIEPEVQKEASEIVEAGYRALAFKYHPDVEGDAEKMVKINRAIDELRRILKWRTKTTA